MVSLQTNILELEIWCSSAECIQELHSGSCCFLCTGVVQGLLQYFTQLLLKIECRSSCQSRDQSPALPSPQRAARLSLFLFSHLYLEFFLSIFPQPGAHWGIASRLAAGRWGSEPMSQTSFDNKEQTATSLRIQRKVMLSAVMKPQFLKVWVWLMSLKNEMLHHAEWPVFLTIWLYQKLSFASRHFQICK